MTEFMRWLAAERGLSLRRLPGAAALVGRRSRRLLGGDLGVLRRPGRRRSLPRPRLARDAGRASGSRTPRSTTPSTSSRGKDDRPRPRSSTAPSCASSASSPGASCARRSPPSPPACAAMGVERGDRVVAYLPNIPETIVAFLATASIGAVWSSCSPDFGAASVDRPLRPDRAQGPVRGRRLPLRRQGLRPPRDRRRAAARRCRASPAPSSSPTSTPTPTSSALARRVTFWGQLLDRRRGRRAALRARPLRPPALGPVLLRHHRPAEGDRPEPGRDPARAPEDAQPPRRRPPRRPPLLVHDDRLDDVELPRLRPAHPGGDRPLRRQPRLPGPEHALGPRRARPGSASSAPPPPTSRPA